MLALGIFVGGYVLWDFVVVESIGIHFGAWNNPLHHMERALVRYARILTSAPSAISEEHVADLRAAGLDVVAILHTCQIVAYFNFANRLADASTP